jgi:hypothetical protein
LRIHFPSDKIVAERFRIIFDSIENLFGQNIIIDLFSNKSTFFALFATIYGLQYGIASKLHKMNQGKKPKPITSTQVKHITTTGKAIDKRTAPENILTLLRGATTHASSRKEVIDYLAGRGNNV